MTHRRGSTWLELTNHKPQTLSAICIRDASHLPRWDKPSPHHLSRWPLREQIYLRSPRPCLGGVWVRLGPRHDKVNSSWDDGDYGEPSRGHFPSSVYTVITNSQHDGYRI